MPKPEQIVDVATPFGRFHTFDDDLITQQLLDYGAHTRNELSMLIDHIGGARTVVDIGAHVGTYAIPIAFALGADARVLAIEGNPSTYELLCRNVGLNGLAHRVRTANAVCGGASPISVSSQMIDGNTGASYFIQDPSSHLYTQDSLALLCASGFARPDLIKIDVEGMELLVLKSFEPIIRDRKPALYLEVVRAQLGRHNASPEDIERFLRPFGYRFFRNVGDRNSNHDRYDRVELSSLTEGGEFFDLLATPAA